MKFMLLIGASRAEWARLGPADWADNQAAHGALIAELRQTGEFIECNELSAEPGGARVVRHDSALDGPLDDTGNFASGYYLVNCADIERACAIAKRLYESRFGPIEGRQVGG